MYSLDIIVPFYNEENFLQKSVERLLEINIHSSITLIDNNSTDSSVDIALNLAKKDNVKYVKTNNKQGKGAALRFSAEFLSGTHVVIHDADLEYFAEDLIELKKLSIKNPTSLILGSRFIGSKLRKIRYSKAYYANKFLSKLFSIVYGYPISDVATCYKLLPVDVFKNLNLTEDGFAIEIEILAKYLKLSDANIIEVPIKYEGRSYQEGKKIKFLDGIIYLIKILTYRF
jgi:dolichol-phosphate mannosyltransferase